ncbi:MAG: DNA repair protein RadC [Burkholderiales bacterium]|nr:DNA repair protein RadC [Burkholderiales bacterium]
MGIDAWPQEQKPRERLLALGAQALSDIELIALILRTGMRGKSAVDLAHEILLRAGGLSRLLTSSPEQLQQASGLGPAKAAQLLAVVAIVQRALHEQMRQRDHLSSPGAVRDYLRLNMAGRDREVFAVLYLDAQNRVLLMEELFAGTLTQTSVFPREVVRHALMHNAAAVIFAHNHPSGVAEPSRADEILTQTLRQALALVDVKVLDHFIVGGDGAMSFAERGLL